MIRCSDQSRRVSLVHLSCSEWNPRMAAKSHPVSVLEPAIAANVLTAMSVDSLMSGLFNLFTARIYSNTRSERTDQVQRTILLVKLGIVLQERRGLQHGQVAL